ncbi:unnamed protein product, partial [Ectocarpus sp. 12 AP-2014]
ACRGQGHVRCFQQGGRDLQLVYRLAVALEGCQSRAGVRRSSRPQGADPAVQPGEWRPPRQGRRHPEGCRREAPDSSPGHVCIHGACR